MERKTHKKRPEYCQIGTLGGVNKTEKETKSKSTKRQSDKGKELVITQLRKHNNEYSMAMRKRERESVVHVVPLVEFITCVGLKSTIIQSKLLATL